MPSVMALMARARGQIGSIMRTVTHAKSGNIRAFNRAEVHGMCKRKTV
jgi:hypothetical protein